MSEPLDLAAIREREKGTTEGPWEAGDNEVTKASDLIYDHPGFMGQPILPWDGPGEVAECYRGDSDQRHADAEFIAHAREDIPALLAEVERLRADRDQRDREQRAAALAPIRALLSEWDRHVLAGFPSLGTQYAIRTLRAAIEEADHG